MDSSTTVTESDRFSRDAAVGRFQPGELRPPDWARTPCTEVTRPARGKGASARGISALIRRGGGCERCPEQLGGR
jgi:hypothetical protein